MRATKLSKKPKYSNRKTVVNGIKFDSVAEARYLPFAAKYAETNGLELRLQEKFELQPKFRIGIKPYVQSLILRTSHFGMETNWSKRLMLKEFKLRLLK